MEKKAEEMEGDEIPGAEKIRRKTVQFNGV